MKIFLRTSFIFYDRFILILNNRYRSSNNPVSYNYTFEQSKDMMRYVNASKPVVLYVHGFEENPTNESVQTVVSGKFHYRSHLFF